MTDTKKPRKSQPTWTQVKARLQEFDRKGLLELIQDLYAAHPENRILLHTRFGLGADVLEPYKKTIKRWISPEPRGRVEISVAKAKQAISDYKKALGDPAGLAELLVFYCEKAARFSAEYGWDDGGYYDALIVALAQAVDTIRALSPEVSADMVKRLNAVLAKSEQFGYGVADAMADLVVEVDPDEAEP